MNQKEAQLQPARLGERVKARAWRAYATLLIEAALLVAEVARADGMAVDAQLTDGANAVKTFFTAIFGILISIGVSMLGYKMFNKLRKG